MASPITRAARVLPFCHLVNESALICLDHSVILSKGIALCLCDSVVLMVAAAQAALTIPLKTL